MLKNLITDRAAIYGIATKAGQGAAGLITAIFIVRYFSPAIQGYCYTFADLLALQIRRVCSRYCARSSGVRVLSQKQLSRLACEIGARPRQRRSLSAGSGGVMCSVQSSLIR